MIAINCMTIVHKLHLHILYTGADQGDQVALVVGRTLQHPFADMHGTTLDLHHEVQVPTLHTYQRTVAFERDISSMFSVGVTVVYVSERQSR